MSKIKYRQAAINAVQFIKDKKYISPVEAWFFATGELFGEGSWGQKKGCPRTAFLGLCEEGYIKGIPQGRYNTKENSLNKKYAITTADLFRKEPGLVNEDSKILWSIVTGGKKIKSNYQVDIVKVLWENNLIE